MGSPEVTSVEMEHSGDSTSQQPWAVLGQPKEIGSMPAARNGQNLLFGGYQEFYCAKHINNSIRILYEAGEDTLLFNLLIYLYL